MESITTIKLHRETKNRLDRLKEFNKETYDEVLRKLLFILTVSKKNPEKSRKMLAKIDNKIKSNKKYTEVYYEKDKEKNKLEDKDE